MNPCCSACSNNATIDQLMEVFPSRWLHLGDAEVDMGGAGRSWATQVYTYALLPQTAAPLPRVIHSCVS